MLQGILDILRSLFEPILTLFDFLIGIIGDLVYVVQLVGAFVVKIPSFFSWLPAEVVAILVIIFGVVVVYKILGRE